MFMFSKYLESLYLGDVFLVPYILAKERGTGVSRSKQDITFFPLSHILFSALQLFIFTWEFDLGS